MDFEEADHQHHHLHQNQQNPMQQHLNMKLGKGNDAVVGHKTPLRGGLGMIVNESKTPGAKSLQGLAAMSSTRKIQMSTTKKETIPIGFEIFQDETEEEQLVKEQPKMMEPELRPCSPIDTVSRFEYSDSLGADIADDQLNWPDQDVILEERPLDGSGRIDPLEAEIEALAKLGIEEWDETPPIDPASRRADDFDYPLSLDEFKFEDVVLKEGDYYPSLYADVEPMMIDAEERKKAIQELFDSLDSGDFEDDELVHFTN